MERFCELVDQLASYGSKTDPLYYTMRFVDGLQHDIKSAVLVQHPGDLDTACVLAKLQEEVAESGRRRDVRRGEFSGSFKPEFSLPKPALKAPLPLPPPPRKVDKSSPSSIAEDRRGTDGARVRSTDDKIAAMRAYRRARGLCMKCAEKWSYGHQCAPTVQLNALQELWELFQLEDKEHSD